MKLNDLENQEYIFKFGPLGSKNGDAAALQQEESSHNK
jgi:hypothetical protein